MTLHAAEVLLPKARVILAIERRRLVAELPDAELTLTGSISLPGMLTRGDVDLHMRVPGGDFERAARLLSTMHTPVHPDIWTAGFATFETLEHDLPTGIALTAIGDEHDTLFRRTWARLATDPALGAAYNDLKRAHDGTDAATYREAKRRFFDAIDLGAEPA